MDVYDAIGKECADEVERWLKTMPVGNYFPTVAPDFDLAQKKSHAADAMSRVVLSAALLVAFGISFLFMYGQAH